MKCMSKKNKPDTRGFVYSTDPGFQFEPEQENTETIPPANKNYESDWIPNTGRVRP